MTAPLDTAALRALCEKATPGPWRNVETWPDEYADDKKWRRINSEEDTSAEASICEVGDWNHDGDADAEFICAARTAVPALLDRVEQLEAKLDQREAARKREWSIRKETESMLATTARERDEARRLATERHTELEALHAELGEPFQSGAVARLIRERDTALSSLALTTDRAIAAVTRAEVAGREVEILTISRNAAIGLAESYRVESSHHTRLLAAARALRERDPLLENAIDTARPHAAETLNRLRELFAAVDALDSITAHDDAAKERG